MMAKNGLAWIKGALARVPLLWRAAAGVLLLTVAVAVLANGAGNSPSSTSGAGLGAEAAPAAAGQAAAAEPAATEAAMTAGVPAGTSLPSWLIKQRQAEALAAQQQNQATSGASAAPAASSPTAPVQPAAGRTSTSAVLTDGRTPLRGLWDGTAETLAAFLLADSPRPSFTVPVSTLAGYYVRYGGEAGLRADLLWAQMLHETGYGRYGGAVSGGQNNFAGIGATGGSEPGAAFASAEAGVRAHVAHMVAYVYTVSPVAWATSAVDPRFDHVSPRGMAVVLADLDGRWAVPGEGYGRRIEDIARAINAR